MPYQPWTNPYQPWGSYQSPQPNMQYGTSGSTQGLVRVTGIEGAKAYQMPPNSMMALFDANDDVFYFKTTDGGGFPTIKVFRFHEVSEPSQNQVEYATVQDVTALHKEIDSLREAISGKQPVRPAAE